LQPLGFSINGSARARVVFAGYGITAPGYRYDDYTGLDAHDAIVLVLTQEPGEMDSTSRFDGNINTPYADLRTKAINAREPGALGMVVVNGPKWHGGEPLRPLESIEAMINMDMVGRLRDDKLQVMGAGTAAEFHALVSAANAAVPQARFDLHTSEDGYGPSDHSSFCKKDIPVLMLFTGSHADYHKPSDTPDKILGEELARVSYFAGALLDSLDARPRPTYTKAESDATAGRIAGGGGYGAWLGTIPDYTQTEGGVLLSGVREGGPAQKAGLRGGRRHRAVRRHARGQHP